MTLDKNRVFITQALQELLQGTTALMQEAITISQQMDRETSTLRNVLSDIPAEALDYGFASIINSIGKFEKNEFHECLQKFQQILQKLIQQIPEYDHISAVLIDQLADIASQLKTTAQGYKDLIGNGFTDTNVDDFLRNLDKYRLANGLKSDTIGQQLDNVLAGLKGMEAYSVKYSKDPVNMATGNFIYDKEDLTISGSFPLIFKRAYNSVNDQAGVLGQDWTHNFEMKLEKYGDIAKVTFGDGRVELYECEAENKFTAEKHIFNRLSKLETGFELRTRDCLKYIFDEDGRWVEQLDLNENTLSLSYSDGILTSVTSPGGAFSFTYTDGFLTKLEDHAGRRIIYDYEHAKLKAVTDELGNKFTYRYDENGKLAGVVNPRNIQTVENLFDERNRTVEQNFPDGGKMLYEYDDDNNKIMLTEQNGNKITYIRDDNYRNTEVIYEDGREISVFNEQNQCVAFTDKNGNITRYEYDDNGNMTCVEDALGNKTHFVFNKWNKPELVTYADGGNYLHTYDENGNLVGVKDPIGREIQLVYNSNGLIKKVIHADKAQTEMSYDTFGNIVMLKDERGAVTKYKYDVLNRVVETFDGNGNITKFAYDLSGRIISVENSSGNLRKYVYNESGKVIKVIDFDSSEVTTEYNELGKISKITNQIGGVTELEYDLMWNISSITEANGARTEYLYNTLNNLSRIKDAKGKDKNYKYDAHGNIIEFKQPNNASIKYKYDALHRRIAMTEANGATTYFSYDSLGNINKIVDALGGETSFKYDAVGQLLEKKDALGNKTSFTYTELGKVATICFPNGGTTRYQYHKGGLLRRVILPEGEEEAYEYDNNRNLISKTNKLGATYRYKYDELNRLKEIINPLGASKKFHHDAIGNVIMAQDENGNITEYHYSALGSLIKVVDALGFPTCYDYNEVGHLTKIEQYGLTEKELREVLTPNEESHNTAFERDLLGHITKVTDSVGQSEHFTYDESGNMVIKLDKDGYETRYEYNDIGKIERILYADDKQVAFSYDSLKQLVEIKDWLGITTADLDALGRPIKVKQFDEQVMEYEWGTLGERTSMTYPDKTKVEYEYDASGRLTRLRDLQGEEIQYKYDEIGRLTKKLLPNLAKVAYDYNELNKISSMKHFDADTLLDYYQYSYDYAGNKNRIIKERSGIEEDSGSFIYDYDELNRLIQVSDIGSTVRKYEYDPFGNRSNMFDCRKGNIEYEYTKLNQLIHMKSDTDEIDYEYDRRGNMTALLKQGVLDTAYLFDATNKLTELKSSTGDSLIYEYSGLGNRISETTVSNAKLVDKINSVIDITKNYHHLISQTRNSGTTNYLWDSSILAASSEQDKEQYYLTDEMGSPIRLLNNRAELESSFVYDEFGVSSHDVQDIDQPFGFTGYQIADSGRLYFAEARYYNHDLGRFTSEDVMKGMIASPNTLNAYSYCFNSPLVYNDFNGKWPSWDDLGGAISDGWNGVTSTVSDVWNNHVVGQDIILIEEEAGGVTHTTKQHVGGNIFVTSTNATTGETGWSINAPSIPAIPVPFTNYETSSGLSVSGSGWNPLDLNFNGSSSVHDKTTGLTIAGVWNVASEGISTKASTGTITNTGLSDMYSFKKTIGWDTVAVSAGVAAVVVAGVAITIVVVADDLTGIGIADDALIPLIWGGIARLLTVAGPACVLA
ncbi:DUF6531 domain-containing protein [Listeria booriae]|uniref:DUF6531 domain-containing protein n=1 Tax=Listeria booriae TaxID=1552123 RepID=UPI00162AF808|nr:DUF6531 domain-containing protein [Listeria booriae]MBC2258910.1 hypothetical protein [Listeria booriae]